jgi:hypothetical protein
MGTTDSLHEHLESLVGAVVLSIDLNEEESQFTVSFMDGVTICIGVDDSDRFCFRSFKRDPDLMH